MASISLLVNGQHRESIAPSNTPLLWVLRDHFRLRGTKFGCGGGFCGACTVLVDGVATRSCLTRAESVVGKMITTIEGLAASRLHPVQAAWIETDVPQCGYCQAGQIMTAVAFLARERHPTDDQIRDAMSGNLCRCGTYHRIRQAVRRAVELMDRNP